jgi:hypothetical protein
LLRRAGFAAGLDRTTPLGPDLFFGDFTLMCHHRLRSVSKLAAKLMPVGLAFCVSLFAGCDSTTVDPTSPEAQKQAAESREKIDKADEAATAQLKKKNKNGPTLKSNFKGGRGANVAPE